MKKRKQVCVSPLSFLRCIFVCLQSVTHANVCVGIPVCRGKDRYRNRLYSVTQYFCHTDKAL